MKLRYLFILTCLTLLMFTYCDTSEVSGPDDPFIFSHTQNPGTSALELLRDDDFPDMIVEVQYMEGYEPTPEALSNLESFLSERLHKNSITILQPEQIPAGGQESYTATEVRELEEMNRSEYSEEGVLATYFIILDGEFSDANVLGIAHYNTSMALFGPRIQDVSSGVGSPSRVTVETIVMQHEFGHIMGLVNNGVEMQEHHQDEENGKHCDDNECLMYFAMNNADFLSNIFEGGNIPELDELCIADLQAAGGK
jgi:predicted Zn-dependent protease